MIRARSSSTEACKSQGRLRPPLIALGSLEAVPGVAKAAVSYKDKPAVVTYDDGKSNVGAATTATTQRGLSFGPQELNYDA
jgi:mercuric ion binding protein